MSFLLVLTSLLQVFHTAQLLFPCLSGRRARIANEVSSATFPELRLRLGGAWKEICVEDLQLHLQDPAS